MRGNQTTRTKSGNIIQFQRYPFQQGSIRLCFRGKIASGPGRGKKAVIKVFKNKKLRKNYSNALKELKVYGIANDYARMFNRLLQLRGHKQTICFPEPDLVSISSLTLWDLIFPYYFTLGDNICAERYLEGQYIKYTNNVGYSAGKEIMQAFQHFTYIKSGKKAICCDLQGVKNGNQYLLTDPAVNSLERVFGSTDMGWEGMKDIINRHECNRICWKLELERNLKYNKELRPVYNSTSMRASFQHSI